MIRSIALSEGISDDELAKLVRRRELVRLQRGAYLAGTDLSSVDRGCTVIEATAAGPRAGGVLGHASAAVLHGLPLWRVPLSRVHVIRPPGSPGSRSSRLHLHLARVTDDEMTTVGGLLLTDITRTVVDLARTLPFESAVVAADAALARRATTSDELEERVRRMGAVPGSRSAARVIAFADRRSESVGASRSRVVLHQLGLPAPDLQVEVHGDDGTLLGRCDHGWASTGRSGSSTGGWGTADWCAPASHPPTRCTRRSCARTRSATPAGRSSAGPGPSSIDPEVIGDRIQRAFLRGRR